jgi:hypothetical protein
MWSRAIGSFIKYWTRNEIVDGDMIAFFRDPCKHPRQESIILFLKGVILNSTQD